MIMTFARNLVAAVIAGLAIGCPHVASAQEPMKIGDLKDLIAWANKMLPGPFSLHAKGEVTAPTPCHDAIAEYAGEDKSNPPIYRLKVTLIQKPGVCIQRLSDIPFAYTQQNYLGNHQKMEIFTDKDSKIIAIDFVQ